MPEPIRVVLPPGTKPYAITDRQVAVLKLGLSTLLSARGSLLLDGEIVADELGEIGAAATAISRVLIDHTPEI